ncbi:MAG: LON peptidase substrate-binding domain-containing protein [Deltaproteobacteria bacterium]
MATQGREAKLAARAAASVSRLKLFPLPEATLLPGAALPLHVFEERYRVLVSDALASDGVIAVPRLQPGYSKQEYLGRPPLVRLAGVGVIERHEQLPDGRFLIVLRGALRVSLTGEHPPLHPYREAVATPLLDDGPAIAPGAADALAACLVRLSTQGEAARAPELLALAAMAYQPEELAAQAALALLSPDWCQLLLEEPSAARRVERVTAAVAERLLEGLDPHGQPA